MQGTNAGCEEDIHKTCELYPLPSKEMLLQGEKL